MKDSTDLQLTHRKARDRSLALLLAGIVLLMPPAVGISLIEATFLGIPVPLIYLFCVWVTLIAGAAILSNTLLYDDPASPPADSVD